MISQLRDSVAAMEPGEYEVVAGHCIVNHEYEIARCESRPDARGFVALRNAAPALLDLAEACEREVDAKCVTPRATSYPEDLMRGEACYGAGHIDSCPVSVARTARLAALARLRQLR